MPSFDEHVARLPALLRQLLDCQPYRYDHIPRDLPRAGIYLFSEGATHLYVGRTGRLRQRLANHCTESSGVNTAAFATLLARQATDTVATYRAGEGRDRLLQDPAFAAAFRAAKARLRACDIRHVAIEDSVDQALFEIYAALALQTAHNTFHNH
jgi:hypothetical protein